MAFPEESRGLELSTVAPSSKLTEPVGVPALLEAVTLAVNVTDWPRSEVLLDELNTSVVGASIVCVKVVAVLAANVVSPP